ncbi:methyl-accepting chemotaxis protein [Thiolinea disciformis]|uniref:methyl-accepting chemotaxis protein n=1 Tax=Thiolinea disciformis TaxID=125614 RepID=UPI00036141B0|nr:HAMP domain-containing methyl-accepting chemotaxis protein [Thiolinea disciformis]
MSNDASRPKARFFDNISVAQRINLLVLIPIILLIGISGMVVYALNKSQSVLTGLSDHVELVGLGNEISRYLQQDYLNLLDQVALGNESWYSAQVRLERTERTLRDNIIPKYQALDQKIKNETSSPSMVLNTVDTVQELNKLADSMKKNLVLLANKDTVALTNYLKHTIHTEITPLNKALNQQVEKELQIAYNNFEKSSSESRRLLLISIAVMILGMGLAAILGYLIYRSIATQMNKLINTMRDISAGDLNARVNLVGHNEMAELAEAFDGMVEQRIATQQRIAADHHQLNDSVFALLGAVADLSDRNLTVRARVTEDATGPLADAINQLAEDTSAVLQKVRSIAQQVEQATLDVNQHALSVSQLSHIEREEAEETAEQLAVILKRFEAIAEVAQHANLVASNTSQATREARESVSSTLSSMAGIRETVQETGKRLKRLGERSQEISRIVDIIGTIAERTTVLALNASMQASAAGEAGRGFSVIAEEIQQLAQSSRESTEQINLLVRNIQQEANTTITTMDHTISEVVSGSKLAEQAAEQMQVSLASTLDLVGSVEDIASQSSEQVSVSQNLRQRAERILQSTQATGKNLLSLTSLTRQMVDHAKQLVASVNVFKLED